MGWLHSCQHIAVGPCLLKSFGKNGASFSLKWFFLCVLSWHQLFFRRCLCVFGGGAGIVRTVL